MSHLKLRLLLLGLLVALSSPSLSGQSSATPLAALADTTIDQVSIAAEHTVLASLAAGPGDLRLQVHQVLNLLVGKDDPRYAPDIPNPGSREGLLKLVAQLVDRLSAAGKAPDLTKVARRVLFYLNLAGEHAQQALRAQRPAQQAGEVAQLLAFLSAARGAREDPLLQGGLRNLRAALAGR